MVTFWGPFFLGSELPFLNLFMRMAERRRSAIHLFQADAATKAA